MRSKMSTSLMLVLLAASVSALPPLRDSAIVDAPELRPRDSCNRDNLLRLFLNEKSSSSASEFCSSYIAPTVTTSITLTTTDAAVVTSTTVSTSTLIKTTYPKRSIEAPGKAITYPPERLSSACSCLITTAPPSIVTETASETTTSTSTTVSTSVAAGPTQYCGIRAWSTTANAVKQTIKTVPNLAACRDLCLQRVDGCASYDYSAGTCYTHQIGIATGIILAPTSPWVWYDVGCPLPK